MSNPARVDLEPAFVLHARPWRETSQMLEVFAQTYGRVGLIARGARRPKSAFRGILNPFQPVRLSWSGRGELCTLTDAELGGRFAAMPGDRVMGAFYINELLLKLLQRSDPHTDLFALYATFLSDMRQDLELEVLLRRFEMALLAELGYELNLHQDALSGENLVPKQLYEFRIEQGAVPIARITPDALCLTGEELLEISKGEFSTPESRASGKRLLRYVLNFHLGQKMLHTRRIASAMKR